MELWIVIVSVLVALYILGVGFFLGILRIVDVPRWMFNRFLIFPVIPAALWPFLLLYLTISFLIGVLAFIIEMIKHGLGIKRD